MHAKLVNPCIRIALFLAILGIDRAPATAQPGPANQGEQKPKGRTIEQPGTIVPFEQVDIYSRLTGFVANVAVDIGDRVNKDQLLAKLFVPELQQELKAKKALAYKAEIGVARAKEASLRAVAALERSKTRVEEAKAALIQSEAVVKRWRAEEQRARVLVEKNLLFYDDEVGNQLRAAEAATARARADLVAAEAAQKEAAVGGDQGASGIKLAHADLDAAQAEAARVAALLQFAEVRAPFDGVVIGRSANPGIFVAPPTITKLAPLFTVARVDLMRVNVDVPELDAVGVAKGMAAAIRVPALDGAVFKGTVSRTAAALDANSRTLRVEIDLPNADGKLLPNMFANVSLAPQTAQQPQEAKSAEDMKTLLKARVALAQRGYSATYKSLGEIKLVAPNILVVKPDEVYAWSVRWLQAERGVSPKATDALANHLERMTQLQAKVKALAPEFVPMTTVMDAEWYRLEAELWLQQAKAKQ